MVGIDWSARSHEELCRRFRWTIPEALNIATLACDKHADGNVALLEVGAEDRRFTFGELRDLSNRLALLLREMGVERGDRVAVLLPQCVENPLAHLAAFKLGAVSVPLSPM